MRRGEPIPAELRGADVQGPDGRSHLGALLRGLTLIVFLRHFGSPHCARQVDALVARLPELAALRIGVVLVGSGPPSALAAFVRDMALARRGVVVVTDPSLAAFRAAGLQRPRVPRPRAAVEALRELAAGYAPGRVVGDRRQLGGALLVDEQGHLVYHHRARSPGDLVDPSDIVQAALTLLEERGATGRRA